MGRMAVKLDVDALCDSVAPTVREAAERWLASGRIGEITAVGGGGLAGVVRFQCGTRLFCRVVAGAFP
jgi:hypothetical protein